MSGSLAVLPLLHPDGVANRTIVFGSACPSELATRDPAEQVADLVVVAPSTKEVRAAGWLDDVIGTLPGILEANGVVYLMVPAANRRHVRRRLGAVGLEVEHEMLHVPSWASTRLILPLRRGVAAEILGSLGLLDSMWRRALAALLAFPGVTALVGGRRGEVALIARPAGAQPLCAWLFRAAAAPPGDGAVAVRIKSRAGRTGVVLQLVDRDNRRIAVAKTTLDQGLPDGRTEREAANLERLGPQARAAGATVPSATLVRAGTRPVMVASAIGGRLASELVGSRRVSVDTMVERIGAWIESWHRSTVTDCVLRGEWLERAVLEPARRARKDLDPKDAEATERYVAMLDALCGRLAGSAAPLVATHGDLTLSNVLIDRVGTLGVVDWEAAEEHGLPMRDFWYAAVDAVAAADRYGDRLGAFMRCFAGGDGRAIARRIVERTGRLARAIGANGDFVTLCFHSCWLHHAANEQRKRAPGEAKPFLAIVRQLASRADLSPIAAVSGAGA